MCRAPATRREGQPPRQASMPTSERSPYYQASFHSTRRSGSTALRLADATSLCSITSAKGPNWTSSTRPNPRVTGTGGNRGDFASSLDKFTARALNYAYAAPPGRAELSANPPLFVFGGVCRSSARSPDELPGVGAPAVLGLTSSRIGCDDYRRRLLACSVQEAHRQLSGS